MTHGINLKMGSDESKFWKNLPQKKN